MAPHLLIVFLAARLAIASQQPLPMSVWTPFAFLWQDCVVVLLFHLFERAVRHEWTVRAGYAVLVLLASANAAVAIVLGSPLTAPLLRAARGPLADSIGHEATATNSVLTASVLFIGCALPFLWRPPVRMRAGTLAALALVSFAGPFATSRTETRGLERNPVGSLVRTSMPRVAAASATRDWRTATGPSTPIDDLSEHRGAAAGRNVVLVVLESTAAQYLHPYGAADDPMPNLTRLAARGIVFDNAYAVYPESIKELIAILSSRYPALDVPVERHAALASPSLASALGTAGYATALFHSGRFMYLGMDLIVERLGFETLADAGDIGGRRDSSFGVDEPSTVEHILRWIDTRPAGRPFFAAYLPIAGHHPYVYEQAGPYSNDSDIDRYRNSLFDGDRALGQLLSGLRARGLEGSTMLVILADHGEAFGQHAGNFGHNLALFEENVRVPVVIALPQSDRAQHVRQPASLLDLAPTLLELLGLPAQTAFQGESLLQPRARAALFFTDYSRALVGLRDGCLKFIHDLESGRSKLFDLCTDRREHADLTSAQPARTGQYRARLREWSAAQVARVRTSPDAPISKPSASK